MARIVRMFLLRAGKAVSNRPLIWLITAFVLSHVMYYVIGIRFDETSLLTFAQYLDPELLKHNLLESLLYLHSQPPLFNLFLGIVLKCSFLDPMFLFQCAYLVCGLVLYCSLFFLQVRMGVNRPLAFVISTAFMASPSFIEYEHWLFYTLPLTVVLTLSGLLLLGFLERKRSWLGFWFFSSLFFLAGIRSLFHISYFALIVVALLALNWRDRKKVMLSALVPFVLILSLYCKNLVLFGRFQTSSWLGIHTSKITTLNLSEQERNQLVSEGKLSELALIHRWSPLAKFPPKYREVTGYEDIPALRQVIKSTGLTNYNHLAYLAISEQYLEDSIQVVRHRPKAYLNGVMKSWLTYFTPHGHFGLLEAPSALSLLNSIYDTFYYGRIPFDMSQTGVLPFCLIPGYHVYLFLFIGLPLLFAYGLMLALSRRSASAGLDRNRRIVILYFCLAMAFVAVPGNLLELTENNRYRFSTEPFSLVLLGLFIQFFLIPRLSRALSRRDSRLREAPQGPKVHED